MRVRMTELRLAEGEEVVRQYSCTAVDNCAVFAGTVIPKGSRMKRESQGTITVTNRRVIYDMEASGKQPSSIHQETRIDSISSVSSIMAKFGRDLRVPILMVIVGFILIFAPYVWAVETDALVTDGDYEIGYNVGVEVSYYKTYRDAIGNGIENTIPQGYVPVEVDDFGSQEYMSGYTAGFVIGTQCAEADIAEKNDFEVPTDLMIHSSTSTWIVVAAIIGAIVFVMGTVLYIISNRTKDWIMMGLSSEGKIGVFITSISGGSERSGLRPCVAGTDYVDAASEIGALIIEQRMKMQRGEAS